MTTPLPMTLLRSGRRMPLGDKLQNEFLAVDDHRVSSVVATGIAGHNRKRPREHVNNLALAFVAPLGPNNDGGSAPARVSAQ